MQDEYYNVTFGAILLNSILIGTYKFLFSSKICHVNIVQPSVHVFNNKVNNLNDFLSCVVFPQKP